MIYLHWPDPAREISTRAAAVVPEYSTNESTGVEDKLGSVELLVIQKNESTCRHSRELVKSDSTG